MSEQSFRQVLLSFGFKRLKKHRDYVFPYHHEETGMYCEVYKDRHPYAWAIGGNLRSSDSYPGGHIYWKPNDLRAAIAKAERCRHE